MFQFPVSRWLYSLCIWCLSVTFSQAQQVEKLLLEADGLFMAGRPAEAALVHESLLLIEPECFESNVWLGNYFYLKGEEKLRDVEQLYKAILNPNRMQLAFYLDQLKAVYAEYYSKADVCLKRALMIRKNEHMQQLTVTIETYRIRIGLSDPPVKRRSRN